MNQPPPLDVSAGMEVYGSEAPPCSGVIKSRPEDFVVEETLAGVRVFTEGRADLLPLYRVMKRGVDTLHLETQLAAALRSRVSFAGMKDKRAVATQHATPTSARAERPSTIEGDGYRAELVGFVEKPLGRASGSANRFMIVLRGCCEEVGERAEGVLDQAKLSLVPNFYGLQRFGGGGALTHMIGRAMVRGEFEGAVRLLLSEPRRRDGDGAKAARVAMSMGDYERGEALLPRGQDIERMVAKRMAEDPRSPIKALRAVPIRLRRLYVQAYQSFIFNRTLSAAMRKGLDISKAERGDNWGEPADGGFVVRKVHGVREELVPEAVPLVQLMGYAYRNYGSRFDSCLEEVMKQEEVTARQFYLEEMQETSVEGGFRRPHMVVRDGTCRVEGDSATLSFTLARGEYATVLLREIIKPDNPEASGFA